MTAHPTNADHLLAELAQTADELTELVQYRNTLIDRCHVAQLSLRTIGDAASLSHTQVANILRR